MCVLAVVQNPLQITSVGSVDAEDGWEEKICRARERREAGRADVSEIAKPASEEREGEMEGLLALSEELLSG